MIEGAGAIRELQLSKGACTLIDLEALNRRRCRDHMTIQRERPLRLQRHEQLGV